MNSIHSDCVDLALIFLNFTGRILDARPVESKFQMQWYVIYTNKIKFCNTSKSMFLAFVSGVARVYKVEGTS
jgi:hypothetical protein